MTKTRNLMTLVDGDDSHFWGDADVVINGKRQRIEFSSRYVLGNKIETYYVSICEKNSDAQSLPVNEKKVRSLFY